MGDLAKKLFHILIANKIHDLNCIFFLSRLDYSVNVYICNTLFLYIFFIVYLFFAISSSYAALLLTADVALFTITHPMKRHKILFECTE